MNRRLLFILIGLAVLVVPTVIAAVIINRSPKLQNTVLKLGNINTAKNTNGALASNTNTTNTNNSVAVEQAQILFVSRNFAETYGSGSNQNNFSNITESEKWATKSYADFLERGIVQQRAGQKTSPYHEILTKVLVMNITKQSTATAAVTVSTQRQETTDRTPKVYYQDLLLDLIKVGAAWQVNAATWKAI